MKDENQELCSCGGKCEGICRDTHRVKLVHEVVKGKPTGMMIPRTCIALYKKEKKREKKRDDRKDHKEEAHDMDYFDLIG
jgi:hypothetical protein